MQTDAISEVHKIEEAIEHLQTSQSLSGINRNRLLRAHEILQEVFADLASGGDEKRRDDEVFHDQRSLMEGMKQYFYSTAGNERQWRRRVGWSDADFAGQFRMATYAKGAEKLRCLRLLGPL
jgi:hypothetical protein